MSWVIVKPNGEVRETFVKHNAVLAKRMGWEVHPIKHWLDKVNKEAKNEQAKR